MVDRILGRSGRGPGEPAATEGRAATAAPVAEADPTAAVWATVQLARNLRRPRTLELVGLIADEFIELHGDRLFGDDPAIVAGLARIDGRRVVVIGQQKGAETDENIRRNFGMPHPEGYRKAMRLMELAERLAHAGRDVHRHARRLSRPGVRGARDRRGDRPLDRVDEPPAHADRRP